MERVQIVSIDEIARLSTIVFDRLRASGLIELSTTRNLYWHVGFKDAFDLSKSAEVRVGDTADDLEDLRREVSEPQEDFVGWHAVDHLTGLLRLVAISDLERGSGRV